jgi:hypothetical protein
MNIKNVVVGLFALGVGVGSYFVGVGALDADKKYEKLFQDSQRTIVGTVLKETYQDTLSPVPSQDGLVSYSNETVKLESKYTLKLQTDDGRILGVSIIDGDDSHGGIPTKKESIDVLIEGAEEVGLEKATKISFPAGNLRHGNWYTGSENRYYPDETYFTPETQAGNKRADRIKILEQE